MIYAELVILSFSPLACKRLSTTFTLTLHTHAMDKVVSMVGSVLLCTWCKSMLGLVRYQYVPQV